MKIFFVLSSRRPAKTKTLFVCYAAILLSAKPVLFLGTSQPASTASLNSNTKCTVESHHGNIVGLNGYYFLLQAGARVFKN